MTQATPLLPSGDWALTTFLANTSFVQVAAATDTLARTLRLLCALLLIYSLQRRLCDVGPREHNVATLSRASSETRL